MKLFCTLLLFFMFINECKLQNLTATSTTLYNESDYDYDIIQGNTFKEQIKTSKDLIKLRKSLLYSYDRFSRPLIDSSNPIKVSFSISIVQINGLNEAYQIMLSTSQVSIKWTDDFLKWNNSIYSKSISFRSDEIWSPDIIVSNQIHNIRFDKDVKETYLRTISTVDMNEKENYPILVRSDGHCVWLFPIKIMSSCELDQQNFPLDRQSCSLIFRSSAYDSSQLVLDYNEEENEIFSDQYESEFDMLNATTQLYFANISPSSSHRFFNVSLFSATIQIERKMTFYLNKIILPYFTFYIVTIFTYLLPVEAGEKKSYSTSILISAMIYLKDTSYFVPKTNETPMLSIYFNLNLIFIFLIVIGSTLVYAVYYLDKMKKPLPILFKRFLVYSRFMYGLNFDRDKPVNLTAKLQNLKLINFEINSTSFNLIRDQLKFISEELINIEKELVRQQALNDKMMKVNKFKTSYFDDDETRDDLGYDALNLLKTMKLVIKDHQINNNNNKILNDQNNDVNNKQTCFKFCTTSSQMKNNDKPRLKEKKYNFKLLSTLESLKNIVNYRKTTTTTSHINSNNNNQFFNRNNTEVISNSEKYLTLLKNYNSEIKLFLNENTSTCSARQQFTLMSTNEIINDLKCVPSYNYEWKYFAIIIDRILFFTFALIIPFCLLWMFLKIH